jgi:hypothetical protein
MANDDGNNGICLLIFVGLFALWVYGGVYMVMGWKLFVQIKEVYLENEYVKAIVDWIFIIIGFIIFGWLLKFFFASKSKN